MSNAAEQLAEVESIHRQDARRPVRWFRVPNRLAAETGITKLGFVELLAGEEIMATNRAATAVQLAFELSKESLRYVDDKPVSTADGTMDAFWARRVPEMSKIRQLVVTAYNFIHVPKKDEVDGFLDSMEISV